MQVLLQVRDGERTPLVDRLHDGLLDEINQLAISPPALVAHLHLELEEAEHSHVLVIGAMDLVDAAIGEVKKVPQVAFIFDHEVESGVPPQERDALPRVELAIEAQTTRLLDEVLQLLMSISDAAVRLLLQVFLVPLPNDGHHSLLVAVEGGGGPAIDKRDELAHRDSPSLPENAASERLWRLHRCVLKHVTLAREPDHHRLDYAVAEVELQGRDALLEHSAALLELEIDVLVRVWDHEMNLSIDRPVITLLLDAFNVLLVVALVEDWLASLVKRVLRVN